MYRILIKRSTISPRKVKIIIRKFGVGKNVSNFEENRQYRLEKMRNLMKFRSFIITSFEFIKKINSPIRNNQNFIRNSISLKISRIWQKDQFHHEKFSISSKNF